MYLTSSLYEYNITQGLQNTPLSNNLNMFENRRNLKSTTPLSNELNSYENGQDFIPSMLFDGFMPTRL